MGPVVSAAQYDRVRHYVQVGSQGANKEGGEGGTSFVGVGGSHGGQRGGGGEEK
jgi:hypothetical protein